MMLRDEAHFGDRVVRCFADRPRSFYEVFSEAVRRNPNGEALVCA
jgi:long-chain acyl-CoA synthetase